MHPAQVRAESLLRIRELSAFFSSSPIDNPPMANCIHGTGTGIDKLAPGGQEHCYIVSVSTSTQVLFDFDSGPERFIESFPMIPLIRPAHPCPCPTLINRSKVGFQIID